MGKVNYDDLNKENLLLLQLIFFSLALIRILSILISTRGLTFNEKLYSSFFLYNNF